jgi:hypothetical protein
MNNSTTGWIVKAVEKVATAIRGEDFIRVSASVLLETHSILRAGMTECGFSAKAVATLPRLFGSETEARLRELAAEPVDADRDADFIRRAAEECDDTILQLILIWDQDLARMVTADVFAAIGWRVVEETAYDKAVEAQRARAKLKPVKDDEGQTR